MIQGSSSTCPEAPQEEDNVLQDLEIEGDQFELSVISGGTNLLLGIHQINKKKKNLLLKAKGNKLLLLHLKIHLNLK